ncbi:hypothetical protein [Succinatimonas hippei]|uniref:Uncharacterized protein n=1 Tax=Succinatimonas hippei (strain DSM 22608 / JCM 16073 / KCTC 15190 / YIT 12066) TaxID=762983 RepID=E8LLC3_SUCHY|nr:hypothetical protein [Succinatimonas hippei]EFY06679.1 hypothetical protein HMPREF9444_01536 [Succinatimonas hippei YIT 12066]
MNYQKIFICGLGFFLLLVNGCSDDPVQVVKNSKLQYNNNITIETALNNFKGCKDGTRNWLNQDKDNLVIFSCFDNEFDSLIQFLNTVLSDTMAKKATKERNEEFKKIASIVSPNLTISFKLSDNKKTVGVENIYHEITWKDGTQRVFPYDKKKYDEYVNQIYNNKPTLYGETLNNLNEAKKEPLGKLAQVIGAGMFFTVLEKVYKNEDLRDVFTSDISTTDETK